MLKQLPHLTKNKEDSADPRRTIHFNGDIGRSSSEEMIGFNVGTLRNDINEPMYA